MSSLPQSNEVSPCKALVFLHFTYNEHKALSPVAPGSDISHEALEG